ncbi:transposase domain containing protein [Trichonephila clavipes]|nr:transposase domain containing protein [Trichonephila clavipes]
MVLDCDSADSPIQCKSKCVPEHTVLRTLFDMGLHSKCPTRGPLLIKPRLWLRQFATSSTVEQLLPPCTQPIDGGIMFWRSFLWVTLGFLIYVEGTVKVVNYLSIIADLWYPYMASVFPTGNGIVLQNSVQCQKARIVLEGFREYNEEFQLIS